MGSPAGLAKVAVSQNGAGCLDSTPNPPRIWREKILAWFFKTIILKYGGASLYEKTRPFFLGLIIGQIVVAGQWWVIDFFTGMFGNSIGYF